LLMFVIFALKDPSNNGVGKVCSTAELNECDILIGIVERQVVSTMHVLPHIRTWSMFRMGDRLCD
jgi:hypothetical protein